MNTQKNKIEEIGKVRMFNGVFNLYRTDNLFPFIKQTKEDMAKDIKDDIDGSVIYKYGCPHPNVKIKSKGVVVGILNKKEGLFTCKKYPSSIFKFPLKNKK